MMAAMHRWVSSTLLTLGSLFLGLLVAEGVLRITGIGYPLLTRADEWTGFALRPGASGWQTDEGKGWVEINKFGMRDKERSKKKPEGTLRIAVLGDSYAEARQVALEDAFPQVMERAFGECELKKVPNVEVLNFGVSGFGTAQELLHLQHKVWEFEPDLIVLAFTTGNDVRNNSFALEGNRDKPYFSLQGDALIPDFSFRDRESYRSQTSGLSRGMQSLISRSRVLQLINRVRLAFAAEEGLDDAIYAEEPDPQWEEAWELTGALLGAMKAEAGDHNVPLVIVTLSNGIQVHPDFQTRIAYMNEHSLGTLLMPDYRVLSFGIQHNIPVLMLAGLLQRKAEEEKTYFHGFPNTEMGTGHWNENGHREAGKTIADFLCMGGFLR